MHFDRLIEYKKEKKSDQTLLGVGPMSKNTVDSVIFIANSLKIPMQLIPSRRQIECEELGGGYVNNWTTQEFSKYVKKHDTGNYVIIARNHGGPWQGTDESDLSHKKAMQSAFVSYQADIDANFDVIHINPSLKNRPLQDIKKDIVNLYEFCESKSTNGLVYECGTEETNGHTTNSDSFKDFASFCKDLSPKIKFLVGQTGTLVKETKNVGKYDKTKARELSSICEQNNLFLKEHNLDYSSDIVLMDHRQAGIHAANVAPHFGLVETDILLYVLSLNKFTKEKNRFEEIATESGKWKKWMLPDSSAKKADKVMMCGHYVLSNPEVQEIYHKVQQKVDLNAIIRQAITQKILHYLKCFGWIR